MHGAGNDHVFVDGFHDELPGDPAAVAATVSDRRLGIGADGLILICPSEIADAEMRMFNADGSQAEMCGNGIRCVAKYLYDRGITTAGSIDVATPAGIRKIHVFADRGKAHSAQVDMGEPQLAAELIPTRLAGDPDRNNQVVDVPLELHRLSPRVTCVSMGNPHCIVYLNELDSDVLAQTRIDGFVTTLGPLIETDPRFPERVNVEFVTILSENEVLQRTWERGSGETMACGTGASAVCVAGALSGRTNRHLVCHLRGGTLTVDWDESSNHVFLTGPAVEVFSGEFDLSPARSDSKSPSADVAGNSGRTFL